jgi:hypothetical protein
MRDIGKLEQRIKNVEYYSALSLVETKAKDSTILYEDNATQKEKYGIITDNFTGFSVGDLSNKDFVCSIENGKLKPYAKTVNFNLVPYDRTFTEPEDPQLPKRQVWSIPSNELIINNQTAATKNTAVIPPVLAAKFEGDIGLFPSTDHYYSVVIPPIVISETPVLPPPDIISCVTPPPPPKVEVIVQPLPQPIDVYTPVLTPRVEPVLPPPVPPPAVPYIPPPPPPVYVAPPPIVEPPIVTYPQVIMDRLPFPSPEDVGQVLVLPPPPLPPSAPPTPPPIVFPGFPAILIDQIFPMPLSVTIPDFTGAAPEVAVIDTWYSAPISVAAEIFADTGGGGGRRSENFDYELH